MKEIAKAILAVMKEVKGIDKTMNVGSGAMMYKGVPDQEVKKIIGASMEKNGLCLIPTEITPIAKIERWEEFDKYSNANKTKQSVFTEVKTKYILLHESGESIEVAGYGHGVDSQDKGAGKATTYALKYALLYMFLVPTGKIDDSDLVHSNEVQVPQYQQPKQELPWLNVLDSNKDFTREWVRLQAKKQSGEPINLTEIRKHYKVSKEVEGKINELINS